MKDLQQILKELRASKAHFRSKYGVKELAVFGSFARDEQELESDIDVVVTLERPLGIAFVDLALELEALLQSKVDLVSRKGIKAKYWTEIERELHYV